MSTALTAAARAEICKVLKWFKAHPGGNRKDMPEELFDVYKQWQKLLIHGDSFFGYPPLVDDSKTMLTFPGLSEFGRRLLEQWDTGPEADTSRDRSGADRDQSEAKQGEGGGTDRGQERTKQAEATPADGAGEAAILPTMLSASDIARRLNLNPKTVSSFLTRFADKNKDCRVENQNKRRNEPTYLYRTEVVWPALEKWRYLFSASSSS